MWLDDLYALVHQNKVDEAINLLFRNVDEQLSAADFRACDDLLETIDVSRLDTNLVVALLSITYPAKEHLEVRSQLVGQAESRPRELAPERVERLMAGRR